MPFEKGHKLAKGGKREGAGRPTKEEMAEKESLRQAIERKREEMSGVLADRYVEMAQEDPATMRHLVDKVLPDEEQESAQPIQITFLRFGSQLSAEELAALTGYDPRRCRLPPSIPKPEEKTQIEHPQVKFHNFSNENGKQRR